jgi:tetratricopeptide (TPR) repeat protein
VNNLALLLDSKGDYGAAEPLFRRALESSERVLGPDHPNTVGSVNNLAALLHSKGAYGEAEPLHRKALESSERVLGPDHPYTLTSLNNLAALLHSKGAYGEAEPFFQRALESYERVLGPDHPYTLTSLNNLAFLLSSKGAYGEAEPLFRRALESCERVLGSEHPDTLSTVNNLARLLESKGDYGEAETLYRRAMEARERVLGPEHPSTLTSVNNLADLLEKQGKLEESNAYQRRFILVQSKNPDLSPLELRTLALDCYKMGDYSRAKELLNRVQEHQFELPSTHCHLARIGILSGREGEARDHAKKAWEYRSEAQPYVLPRILWLQLALAFLQNSRCKSSDPIPQELLGRLKAALQSPDAHVEWSMDPVLAHLKPKLPPEVHELLTALVAALSDRAKLADLDRFPAWRAAKPIRD